eukprot:996469_1
MAVLRTTLTVQSAMGQAMGPDMEHAMADYGGLGGGGYWGGFGATPYVAPQGTSSQQQTGTPHQNDQSGTVIGDTTFYGGAAYNTYGTVGYGSSYGTGYGAHYGGLGGGGYCYGGLGGGGYGGGFGTTPYGAPQGTSSQQQTGTPHQNDQSGTVIGDTTFYGGAAYN